jgi:hypothetical protein
MVPISDTYIRYITGFVMLSLKCMNIRLKFQSAFTPVRDIDYSDYSIRFLSLSEGSLLRHHEYKCSILILKVRVLVQWGNKTN